MYLHSNYPQILAYEKRQKHEKKIPKKRQTFSYATFQSGRNKIFKFYFYFFCPQRRPQKLLIIGPKLFFSTGPAALTAQTQKSRTLRSPLRTGY